MIDAFGPVNCVFCSFQPVYQDIAAVFQVHKQRQQSLDQLLTVECVQNLAQACFLLQQAVALQRTGRNNAFAKALEFAVCLVGSAEYESCFAAVFKTQCPQPGYEVQTQLVGTYVYRIRLVHCKKPALA
jgi:hypothetical protein